MHCFKREVRLGFAECGREVKPPSRPPAPPPALPSISLHLSLVARLSLNVHGLCMLTCALPDADADISRPDRVVEVGIAGRFPVLEFQMSEMDES